MFVVLRTGITDKRGACLINTGGDSLRIGLAWASDDGAIRGPVKGRLSGASHCSEIASAACSLAAARRSSLQQSGDCEKAGHRSFCRGRLRDERWRLLAELAAVLVLVKSLLR
jgi:hypothetical protein